MHKGSDQVSDSRNGVMLSLVTFSSSEIKMVSGMTCCSCKLGSMAMIINIGQQNKNIDHHCHVGSSNLSCEDLHRRPRPLVVNVHSSIRAFWGMWLHGDVQLISQPVGVPRGPAGHWRQDTAGNFVGLWQQQSCGSSLGKATLHRVSIVLPFAKRQRRRDTSCRGFAARLTE